MSRAVEKAPATRGARGGLLFVLGALLVLSGPFVYVYQLFGMQNLTVPWYSPALGTLGVLLLIAAFWKGVGVVRGVVVLLGLLLTAGQWYFVAHGTRLPEYTGPARQGQPLPDFQAVRADGSVFTNSDLLDKRSALVFFRGRW